VDRLQLHLEESGVDRQRAWRNAATASSRVVRIVYGRLGDGRWWAERNDDKGGAFVFGADEQGATLALRLAYRWMRDSGQVWHATPAGFDAQGRPLDGLPWVRRGGEWHLEPDVSEHQTTSDDVRGRPDQ
jgi:hypothetical protein